MTHSPSSLPRQALRRRQITRHLLTRHQFREPLKMNMRPALRMGLLAGAQPALTTLLAITVTLLSPWPHLVGYAGLGGLVGLFARFAAPEVRNRTVMRAAAIQTGSVAIMSIVAWSGLPMVVQIGCLAVLGGVLYLACIYGRIGVPGAVIFMFAASAAMAPADSLLQVGERVLATGTTALVGLLIVVTTDRLRVRLGGEGPRLPEPGLDLRYHLIAASRIALGALSAALIVYAAGAHYPGWAAIGALAVMQVGQIHASMNRAMQRMAGAVIGAALVWLILGFSTSTVVVAGFLVLLILMTEVVILSNYGLAQILITPMALLMTVLAAPAQAGSGVVLERIMDTVAGSAVGLVLAIVFSTMDERMHFHRHHSARTHPRPTS